MRAILWYRLPQAGLPEDLGHRTEEDVLQAERECAAMSHIMTKESELRLHWAELQELEQKVVELIATALKLAPGLEWRDELAVIGSFQVRIAAMKRAELARASRLKTA